MNFLDCDIWSNLLWEYFGPHITSGAPFYLAADSNLIVELARKQNLEMTQVEALQSFDDCCLQLLDRKSTRALIKESAYRMIPGKSYSRVMCLAVQQVLVVESMLNHDQYSDRAYFPRYRARLKIQSGKKHETPIQSSSFQRIWSTLAHEITNTLGTTSNTITFRAGSGNDINRNLPFSQALFTQQDLQAIHSRANIDSSTEIKIVKHIIKGCLSNLNKRAKRLFSEATTNQQLGERLWEQVRSFKLGIVAQSEPHSRSERQTRRRLVANFEGDDFEDLYGIYLLDPGSRFTQEPPTDRDLKELLSNSEMVAFSLTDTHYEEIDSTNEFEPDDQVMLLLLTEHEDAILRRFAEYYDGRKPRRIKTNLSEEFVFLYCGPLPNSLLFDPLGRKTKSKRVADIVFLQGLPIDARTELYLAGYTPQAISCQGRLLEETELICVNGSNKTVKEFLGEIAQNKDLRSYTVNIESYKQTITVVSENPTKPVQLFGYSLIGSELAPIASALNVQQPSLRGAVILKESEATLSTDYGFSPADLLTLLDRGPRVPIPTAKISELIAAIERSEQNDSLVKLAMHQVKKTKSVPITAIKSIRRLGHKV